MDSSGSSDLSSNNSGDAEGVWSTDIDQAFHEALQIYPPCGRRKIILSDEGKMYGRNELIARYIKIRCGKTRTRKQVSSHIQVLARKKQRESNPKTRSENTIFNDIASTAQNLMPVSSPTPPMHLAIPNVSEMAESPPSSSMNNFKLAMDNIKVEPARQNNMISSNATSSWPCNISNNFLDNRLYNSLNDENQLYLAAFFNFLPFHGLNFIAPKSESNGVIRQDNQLSHLPTLVASSKLILCGFNAYIEQSSLDQSESGQICQRFELIKIPRFFDESFETIKIEEIFPKYPPVLQQLFDNGPSDAFFIAKCWANVSFEIQDVRNALYAVDSYYKSSQRCEISVSTKVCSLGKQVVEKVEVYSPIESADEINDLVIYNFRLERSPICDMVVQFITTLKKHELEVMNSVLENFTILQVVTDRASDENLMVICFMFEVSPEDESSTRIYRLVR